MFSKKKSSRVVWRFSAVMTIAMLLFSATVVYAALHNIDPDDGHVNDWDLVTEFQSSPVIPGLDSNWDIESTKAATGVIISDTNGQPVAYDFFFLQIDTYGSDALNPGSDTRGAASLVYLDCDNDDAADLTVAYFRQGLSSLLVSIPDDTQVVMSDSGQFFSIDVVALGETVDGFVEWAVPKTTLVPVDGFSTKDCWVGVNPNTPRIKLATAYLSIEGGIFNPTLAIDIQDETDYRGFNIPTAITINSMNVASSPPQFNVITIVTIAILALSLGTLGWLFTRHLKD